MARILTGFIKAALGLNYRSDIDLGSGTAKLPFAAEIGISSGTGAGQSDLAFWDARALTASQTEDLDLAAGLTDAFGAALTFVEVTAIYVKAHATNQGNIVIGGDGAAAFVGPFGAANDTVKLAAGQSFLITNMGAGWPVTATTADLLQIANDHASAAGYDIAIVGRSA
jgi:hypothetical protein